jgi:hypothetical protein
VKRFRMLGGEWRPGGEGLTSTMKLERNPIAAKNVPQTEELCAT